MIIKDHLHRKLTISKSPKRVISLVPSLTELMVDLGLENKLVGITRFCVHPINLKKTKTIIGGTKKINLEKIIALKPDFILANKEENTKEIVNQLTTIAPTFVTDLNTIESVLTLINQLGLLFNCSKNATELITTITTKQAEFLEIIKLNSVKKVAYLIWENPIMVAGKNTFINALLKQNKFQNIFENFNRYPEIKITDLQQADYILLSSEPYPFTKKHKTFYEKQTNAKVILVDGEYFSWCGSRLVKAFDYFRLFNKKL